MNSRGSAGCGAWCSAGLLATLALGADGARAVTVESLQGATIQGSAHYDMHARLQGRETRPQARIGLRLTVGSGGSTSGTFQRVVTFQGREVGRLDRSFSGKLGTPAARGDGHALWLLSGDKLILLRTYEVGGAKIEITFTADGRSCSLRAPIVREVGAGNTRMESAVKQGAKVEILGSQQVSSNCSVSR